MTTLADKKNRPRKSESVARIEVVPPGRLERPHPAPEAGALSTELWGPVVLVLTALPV